MDEWLNEAHDLIDERNCVHDVDFLESSWVSVLKFIVVKFYKDK